MPGHAFFLHLNDLFHFGWALALLPGTRVAMAQAPTPLAGAGSVTGLVLDSLSRQPVAYATVPPPAPAGKLLADMAADD